MNTAAQPRNKPSEAESPPRATRSKRDAQSFVRFRRYLRYREFCLMTGIGLSKLKELIKAGRVRVVGVDTLRRIPIEELDRVWETRS